MDRRQFLRRSLTTLAGVVIMGGGWERSSAFADPPPVEQRLLDNLAHVTEHYLKASVNCSPIQIHQDLLEHVHYLRDLLDHAMSDNMRRQLLTIAGEAMVLAARNAYVLGNRHQSEGCISLAYDLAKEAGNRVLRAAALSQSAAFLYSAAGFGGQGGDPVRALELRNEAVVVAGPKTDSQLLMAMLAGRAEEYAVLGDMFNCMLDLNRADELLGRDGPWSDALVPPASRVELDAIRGNCFRLLGREVPSQAKDAAILLRQVHAEMAPSRVSWRATVQADLGAAYAEQGEVEEACKTLLTALRVTDHHGARHNVTRIAGIRQDLLNVDSSAVQELDDQLRSHIMRAGSRAAGHVHPGSLRPPE
jgi:tetratricopeptide (TPR) repeat protein